MDRINYFDEYFSGNIDYDTFLDKVCEAMKDGVMYFVGAIECAKYMHDYHNGDKPIYPSEMTEILNKFLEHVGYPEDYREDINLEDISCSGCVYEDVDGSTAAISNCVCCSRNVEFAKNDNYRKKG